MRRQRLRIRLCHGKEVALLPKAGKQEQGFVIEVAGFVEAWLAKEADGGPAY